MICRVQSMKLYLQQNEFMSIKCQKIVISTVSHRPMATFIRHKPEDVQLAIM